jgi:signal transduction histidine kinase
MHNERVRPARGVQVALYVLFWTAVGVVFALPQVVDGDARALPRSLAQWWSWGLVAPLIAMADRRLPVSERNLGRRLLAHLPASLLFTALHVFVSAAVRAALGLTPWSALGSGLLIGALRGMYLWSWLVYWLIVGGWLALRYYERYVSAELRMARLERLSSEARLHALRLQIDPHFLFNSLNTISSHVESDPRLARRMIEHLGDLLRLTLESKDRTLVPLGDELAFLEHYLAIQRLRFGDRLAFESAVAEDVRHALVPALLIQPLVENAVRHGLSSRASGGRVRVAAEREDGHVRVLVEDDGVGLPPAWSLETSTGVGLSVTRQRVLESYPPGASAFEVRPRAQGGVEVEIRLPFPPGGPA